MNEAKIKSRLHEKRRGEEIEETEADLL